MITTFNYGPRQIGKSSIIIEKYLENPDKIGVLCRDNRSAIDLSYKIRNKGHKINEAIAPNVFDNYHLDNLKGSKCEMLYVDEIDHFNGLAIQFMAFLPSTVEEVHAFTSPSHQRDLSMFLLVKQLMKTPTGHGLYSLVDPLVSRRKESVDYTMKLSKMFDDPLIRAAEIIQLPIPEWWDHDKDQWIKESLSKEAYEMEILGQIFKLK